MSLEVVMTISVVLAIGFMFLVHMQEKKWNTTEFCKEQDRFKAKHGIWLEWTGSVYVERMNPNPTKDTNHTSTIKSNWETGVWEQV